MNNDLANTLKDTPRRLLRSDLCKSSGDPKLDGSLNPVYVPEQDMEYAKATLSNPAQLKPLEKDFDQSRFYGIEADHGLLYMPFPYLVPGGRFNEMYGWDSAFPVFAWVEHHPQMMREQIDNQLYQIRLYGKVLNANRTYYLSRSQPPLLSTMVMSLLREARRRDWKDFDPDGIYKDSMEWLAAAYPTLGKFHAYWTSGDRLAGETGLSRYWDDSDVAAPEVVSDEKGHFHHAKEFYSNSALTIDDQEDAALFYDRDHDRLTPLYHRANRAMRASGFDPTGHWGYGALRCMFHATGCLNALLYNMESDLSEIALTLDMKDDHQGWVERKRERKARMRNLMYDATTGTYQDFDFIRKRVNEKPFATLFHAMWAGLYDRESDREALDRAVTYALKHLETPYGISTSAEVSGSQWDHPYGWPPLQYFAFEGLRRCGYIKEARRVAEKFANLTEKVFNDQGSLFEKYNVADGNAEVHVVHGYHVNVSERGTFLWTAAVLVLAHRLLNDTAEAAEAA